jgi:hypothetical protein
MRKSGIIIRLIASVTAVVASWGFSHFVFQDVPVTTDESSYVFQANNFSDGMVARPNPPLADVFFRYNIISGHPNAGWLSRYPPGHSLWLVPGALFGHPRLMISLAAGLSVWVLTGCGIPLGIPPLVTSLLLLFSPYFLFMHGTLLSHTSGMLAVSLMLGSYIAWVTTGRPGYAALAGLSWSWLFLNRTFTGLLLAMPFGIDAMIQLLRNRKREVLAGVAGFALCAGIGVALYLAYNYAAVGDPFTPTYRFYAPGERPGFGVIVLRDGSRFEHDLARGLGGLRQNAGQLNDWLFGFHGSLWLVGALFLVGASLRWSPLLLLSTLCVWLGQVCFWHAGVNIIGPFYYFETLPFLLVGAGLGITRLRLLLSRRKCGAGILILLAAAGAAASLGFTERWGRHWRSYYAPDAHVLELLKTAPNNSIVVLKDIPEDSDERLSFNLRGLETDPLVVSDFVNMQVLNKCFPTRHLFVLQGIQAEKLVPPDLSQPPELLMWADNTFALTGRNQEEAGGHSMRAASEDLDGANWLVSCEHRYIYPGRFIASFALTASGIRSNSPVRLDVATDFGRKILAHRDIWGDVTGGVVRLTFESDDFLKIEPRVYYGGSGYIAVRSIRIEEDTAEKRSARETSPSI